LLETLAAEISRPELGVEIRGRGLMIGLEIKNDGGLAMRTIKEMLRRGFILLPEGANGSVISFTPPLTIARTELSEAVTALKKALS
jgi:4-aminobutyrate aminotransferase-like enzyme